MTPSSVRNVFPTALSVVVHPDLGSKRDPSFCVDRVPCRSSLDVTVADLGDESRAGGD
jgi:hypothetical protein